MDRLKMLNVTILAFLLMLTGCFGLSSGDAEADDDANSGGTTIVNNYYNSTTIVQDEPERFTIGGVVNWTNNTDCENQSGQYLPDSGSFFGPPGIGSCNFNLAQISTNSGELLTIIEGRGIQVMSTCDDMIWLNRRATTNSSVDISSDTGFNVIGSAMNCDHVIKKQFTAGSGIWSVVYTISNVTLATVSTPPHPVALAYFELSDNSETTGAGTDDVLVTMEILQGSIAFQDLRVQISADGGAVKECHIRPPSTVVNPNNNDCEVIDYAQYQGMDNPLQSLDWNTNLNGEDTLFIIEGGQNLCGGGCSIEVTIFQNQMNLGTYLVSVS